MAHWAVEANKVAEIESATAADDDDDEEEEVEEKMQQQEEHEEQETATLPQHTADGTTTQNRAPHHKNVWNSCIEIFYRCV